jgi:oxygen-independent coproporphyrinogen-3 oxidase
VELHPDDVTVETLQKLKAAGVARISIGRQSFDEGIVRKLGREPCDYNRLFSVLQEVPFDTVAIDFIFAIEGQTFDSVKSDIDTAFANGANHIALYPFIDFAFAKNNVRKMPSAEVKKLLYDISNYCESQGYVRDSIWTFGKPGVSKYSSMTRDNYLGFGCSATTLLPNQFKVNTFSLEAYSNRINEGKLPTALTIRFTRRQRMVYWLFWRFYTTRLSSNDFQSAFGVPVRKMYGIEFWFGRLFGLLKKEGDDYCLTTRGVFYYYYFEGYYTLAYIDRMWGIMRMTPFPGEMIL